MKSSTFLLGGALLLLALLPAAATPLQGQMYDCSGTVGAIAANVSFPASGKTGPTAPTSYLLIQNNSTSGQDIWFSALPGVTAATAPPSWRMVPTAGFVFTSTDPVPPLVSIIGSASSAAYTCNYQ